MSSVNAKQIIERAIGNVSKLPASIRFGTSSWTFEGWRGLVFHEPYKSKAQFTKESLEEYGRFPLFRAVGIDSTYYRPPTSQLLQRLRNQAPNTQMLIKVWQEITSPRFEENFLNPHTFAESIIREFVASGIQASDATLLLQFSKVPEWIISDGTFLDRLAIVLKMIPENFKIAIEPRNFSLLSSDYISLINERKIKHVFSWSSEMPQLIDQLKAVALAGGISAAPYIVRALLPPGGDYEATNAEYSPFDTERRPNCQLHLDIQRIIRRGLQTERDVTVIFSNNAEGCAPVSVAKATIETAEVVSNANTQPNV